MEKNILILDDQENIRNDLKKYLELEAYTVFAVSNINSAIEIIRIKKIHFALIDLKIDFIREYGGIELMRELNKMQPSARIIILSAYELNDELKKQLSEIDYMYYISKGGEKNYIESVISVLNAAKDNIVKKKCFVIMPFSTTKNCTSDEWEDIFENMIKPAVEKSGYNYSCHKTSLMMGNIIVDILDNLNRSDLVIADLTDRNPNVFYELGVRHALRDSTILITQEIEDIPFDLRPYALIAYKWKTQKGKKSFATMIKKALKDIENETRNTCSPVREYLKLIP